MATALTMTVFGDREVAAKFKTLPKRVQGKVLRQSLRPAAKIVNEEAKQQVPVDTGALRKSLKLRAGKKRKRGVVAIVVQTGAGFFQGETYYGGFVQFGHRIGSRKLGDARKMVPANPFLTRAYDAKKDQALRLTESLIASGVERESRGSG